MIYQTGDLVLDKYRIETILGQSAWVDVYRVSNISLNVPRVLKIFKRDDFQLRDADYSFVRQRFKQEAQLSNGLNSPNKNPYLLQVYELIDTRVILALEEEYAPGGNLTDRMRRYTDLAIPFPRDKALRIAFETAAGLASLHSYEIVHRNLKPANILFDQHDHALLADYGLAQLPGGLNQRSLLNNQFPTPGSTGYLSPEQRRSVETLAPTSDIYALGLVLFEILTGKSYSSVGHRNRLRDSIPGIKLSLDDLVARMLSELPRSRPKDGKAAAIELHRELEAEELIQREIQGKKKQDYEEWERLKSAELARQRELKVLNPVVQEIQAEHPEESAEEELDEIIRQELENPQNEEISQINNYGAALPDLSQAENSRDTTTNAVEDTVTFQPERRTSIFIRRFWWVGVLVLLVIASIPFLIGIVPGMQIPMEIVQPSKIDEIKPTAVPPTIQITRLAESLPIQQSTLTLTQAPTPSLAPTSTSTLAPTSTPSRNFTETPLPLQLVIPTTIQTEVPVEIYPTSPVISPDILMNPGFEEPEGWASKSGDAHILGRFSDAWASEGKISYQIALFGDYSYEYCFTPGMRTTLNQNVDLTNVRKILFDLNIRPAVNSEGFHGEKISISPVVFIDGEQVYISSDGIRGELLEQEILLDRPYNGRHDLKFGLMASSRFCVKGITDDESFLMYIDNIRFVYP